MEAIVIKNLVKKYGDLAAVDGISTTILSSRSWAETCSAMVSRSRLSKTRGPPDALRMCCDPPP
jgi:hypothetical protein